MQVQVDLDLERATVVLAAGIGLAGGFEASSGALDEITSGTDGLVDILAFPATAGDRVCIGEDGAMRERRKVSLIEGGFIVWRSG